MFDYNYLYEKTNLQTIIWFQVFLSNTNNTVKGF